MKPRLVFVDDDRDELNALRLLVEAEYEYVPLHWPSRQPTTEPIDPIPALFVLDMYLPPATGAVPDHIPIDDLQVQAQGARKVAQDFSGAPLASAANHGTQQPVPAPTD